MIARLARGRKSATRVVLYELPASVILASGLAHTRIRPMLVLIPGRLL